MKRLNLIANTNCTIALNIISMDFILSVVYFFFYNDVFYMAQKSYHYHFVSEYGFFQRMLKEGFIAFVKRFLKRKFTSFLEILGNSFDISFFLNLDVSEYNTLFLSSGFTPRAVLFLI